jgi:pimeloyl-ACP methyl ester carboxylesterase
MQAWSATSARRWRLTMPALVMAGTHDKVSQPLVVRRMAERIPAAPTELDAGHLAPFEEPEAFAAAVQAFLAGLDHAPVTFVLWRPLFSRHAEAPSKARPA